MITPTSGAASSKCVVAIELIKAAAPERGGYRQRQRGHAEMAAWHSSYVSVMPLPLHYI